MDKEKATRLFNTRLTDDDYARLERLRDRLQERYGPRVRVTYRTVIQEAMDTLEKRLDDLERKR